MQPMFLLALPYFSHILDYNLPYPSRRVRCSCDLTSASYGQFLNRSAHRFAVFSCSSNDALSLFDVPCHRLINYFVKFKTILLRSELMIFKKKKKKQNW